MTSEPRKLTPQEEARLEQVRQNFKKRRAIGENLAKIKRRIGIYSGKGGVGKTTVATNLAVLFAKKGLKVALFDCDIDCPNAIRVLNITLGPQKGEQGQFIPPTAHGVKVMSMGFFQSNEEEAIIWRGPMIHNAINQFLELTVWGDTDLMLIDLPPGTSDAPLTVMQTVNADGFVVVTTPQSLATLDAKRSANMIRKLNLNVIGIVENMSGEFFGQGAGEELAEDLNIPFLGRLTMRKDYREAKQPPVLSHPEVAAEYERLADALHHKIGLD